MADTLYMDINKKLNEIPAATDHLSIGNGTVNYLIKNVSDPVDLQDVATKNYVDTNSITKTAADTYYMDISQKLNEIPAPSGNVSMSDGTNNYQINNVSDPTAN